MAMQDDPQCLSPDGTPVSCESRQAPNFGLSEIQQAPRPLIPGGYGTGDEPLEDQLPIPTDEQLRRANNFPSGEPRQEGSITDTLRSVLPRLNPQAWDAWLRSRPSSTNIEDRQIESERQQQQEWEERDRRARERWLEHHRESAVKAQGGLVNMPGYYQRGGLGIPQMNTLGKEAHFGALNTQRAARIPGGKLSGIGGLPHPSVRATSMRPAGGGIPIGRGRAPGVHLIHSPVPGRTDRIPMRARTGSYILPADVVSGLGQGNTYAGAKMWGQAITHAAGPYGSTNTLKTSRLRAPTLRMTSKARPPAFKGGGGALWHHAEDTQSGYTPTDYTPIITAGGECLIDPEIVRALGAGDPEQGKKMLADSVKKVRQQVIQHMKKLPGPVS